jgi:hypothetical protein
MPRNSDLATDFNLQQRLRALVGDRSRRSRLTRRRRRRLSFEQLESRTLLAANPINVAPIGYNESVSALPYDYPSLITDGSGFTDVDLQIKTTDSATSPEGQFYVNDSMLLRIDLVDSNNLPIESDVPIQLIVEFDPTVLQPEGVVLPGEIPCELIVESSTLTVCLQSTNIPSMRIVVSFRVIGTGTSPVSVTAAPMNPGNLGSDGVFFTATEVTATTQPTAPSPFPVIPGEQPSQTVRDSLATANGLINIRPLTPRTSLAKSTGNALPFTTSGGKRVSTAAGELTIEIVRRTEPSRSATDWTLFADATANLFLPLELHDFQGPLEADALTDRRTVRVQEATPREESRPRETGWNDSAEPGTHRVPAAVQPFAIIASPMPILRAAGRDLVSVRVATPEDYDAILAAWPATVTPTKEESP